MQERSIDISSHTLSHTALTTLNPAQWEQEIHTEFGIYGQLSFLPQNDLYPKAIPVASIMQIQTGSAEILTVIEGNTVEHFNIEIEKVSTQDYPASKGLVIKATDARLLAKTGGIKV